jgi:coniferyl-aldehyde dehydrogenase
MPQTVRAAFDTLHSASRRDPFPTADEREDRLKRLETLMVRHRNDLVAAISDDFGFRSKTETLSADVLLVIDAVRDARKHLRGWMRRRPARPHPLFAPSRAWVEPVPKGVVGVIAPWNYPVNLALGPLAGVLAAGNRALVKPSEATPRTSSLLRYAVADFFSAEEVAVVEGGPEVSRALTALPLDHLLFTGSTQVGRLVALAAAEHLVPVTLELGGKSPVLVHADADLEQAAERVAVGKLFNAGQTCIAPDYVLVPRGRERAFAAAFCKAVARLAPRLEGVTSLASDKGLRRVTALLEDARAKGATVEGANDLKSGRVMAPVVVLDVNDSMRLMQEELFCPVLPVEGYDSLDEAVARINARPRPLAFYYFDDDASRADGVLRRVPSGGACINDTLVHFAQERLPFGGLGASGSGAYHGQAGFEAFSHLRGVLSASRLSAARSFMTPPFGPVIDTALEFLIRGIRRLR